MIKNRWLFAIGLGVLMLMLPAGASFSQVVFSWHVVYPLLGVALIALSIEAKPESKKQTRELSGETSNG